MIKQGWLSPQGEFITDHDLLDDRPCHENLAFCILFDLYKDEYKMLNKFEVVGILKDKFDETYATQALEKCGYIRLCNQHANQLEWIILDYNTPNTKQHEYMLNWARQNKIILDNHTRKYF